MSQNSTAPIGFAKPRRSSTEQLAVTVAERLKRLIGRKGGSFERLAELSGIDPDELLRIERGAETPKIGHLWRIANALGVPFGSLVASKERQGVLVIRKNEAQAIGSADGAFLSRPLFPYDSQRPVEFYHVVLAPSHIERAEAHAPGTKENLVVAKGLIEIVVGREPPVQLDEGDAIDFLADVPHSYRNLGTAPAALYLVMSYEAPAEGVCS
ncbi:MAG TPA: XRE family transcriptional regulator [Methylocystis sp.]|nr:XRE family transcriptional regulator [Methylocystis sp.]